MLLHLVAYLPQQQAHELATGVGVTARGWVAGRAGCICGGSLVCALLAGRRCRFRRTIALLSCLAGNRANTRRRLQPCIMNVNMKRIEYTVADLLWDQRPAVKLTGNMSHVCSE